jgi:hypothetical protein
MRSWIVCIVVKEDQGKEGACVSVSTIVIIAMTRVRESESQRVRGEEGKRRTCKASPSH